MSPACGPPRYYLAALVALASVSCGSGSQGGNGGSSSADAGGDSQTSPPLVFASPLALATETPAEIHIVPATVYVQAGATFELAARFLDDEGVIMPESTWQLSDDSSSFEPVAGYGPIDWSAAIVGSSADAPMSFSGTGRRVEVTAGGPSFSTATSNNTTGTTPTPVTVVQVTAEYQGKSASSTVHIVNDVTALQLDLLASEHVAKTRPTYAYASADCRTMRERVAYIWVGWTSPLTTSCSDDDVIAFTVDREAGVKRPTWTTGPDLMMLGETSALLDDPVELPVALWIALDDTAKVAEAAVAEARLASAHFNRNGAGLKIVVEGDSARHIQPIATIKIDEACDPVTGPGKFLGASQGDPVPDLNRKDVVHVIYVEDLYGSAMARTCGYTTRQGRSGLIIVSSEGVSLPDILGHELGHAFSLDHAKKDDGFGNTNVMKPFVAMTDPPRDHLTMGQLYRLNLNDESRLNESGVTDFRGNGLTLVCQLHELASGPCPPTSEDI